MKTQLDTNKCHMHLPFFCTSLAVLTPAEEDCRSKLSSRFISARVFGAHHYERRFTCKMKTCALFLLSAFLLAKSVTALYSRADDVIELTSANFQKKVGKSDSVWCVSSMLGTMNMQNSQQAPTLFIVLAGWLSFTLRTLFRCGRWRKIVEELPLLSQLVWALQKPRSCLERSCITAERRSECCGCRYVRHSWCERHV